MAATNPAAFKVTGSSSGAHASLQGGGVDGVDATAGETLTVQLEDPVSGDVEVCTYSVYDAANASSPLASKNADALTWTTGGLATVSPSPATDGEGLDMPAAASGQSWIFRCTVVTGTGTYVYERIVCLRTTGSYLRKPVPAETTQYSARGWSDDLDDLVDAASVAVGWSTVGGSAVALVDQARGSDSTGAVGGLPFETIPAALTAAGAAATGTDQVIVIVRPGTYVLDAGLVVPDYVYLRGEQRDEVFLQFAAACTALDLTGQYCGAEDLTVRMIAASAAFVGADVGAYATLRRVTVLQASAGDLVGVIGQDTDSGGTPPVWVHVLDVAVYQLATGSGTSTGVTATGEGTTLRARGMDVAIESSGGTPGDAIGALATGSGELHLMCGTFGATSASGTAYDIQNSGGALVADPGVWLLNDAQDGTITTSHPPSYT